MKTKNFVEEIEKLGLVAVPLRNKRLGIQRAGSDITNYAYVETDRKFSFSTSPLAFDELDKEMQGFLFDALVRYSETPVEEREEEKKYRYEIPFNITRTGGRTYHISRFSSSIGMDSSDFEYVKSAPCFHFTKKEVEKYTGKERALFDACDPFEITE